MTGIMAIIVALVLLMVLAYRGLSLLILAPLLAALVALVSVDTPLLASYTQVFMGAASDFILRFFPLFLLGAIFGKLMEDSGSAEVLASAIVKRLGDARAILAVVLACAVMTYGGVSLFVVAFAVYPIAAALFRQANLPKRLIPGTIALGAFTFTMTALPGTPAIQNAIPMPYFGTSPFAAPGLGILTGLVMLVLGQAWLNRRARQARLAGEGYGEHQDNAPTAGHLRERAAGEGFDLAEMTPPPAVRDLPPPAAGAAAHRAGDRPEPAVHGGGDPGHGDGVSRRAGLWCDQHRVGARGLVGDRRPGGRHRGDHRR